MARPRRRHGRGPGRVVGIAARLLLAAAAALNAPPSARAFQAAPDPARTRTEERDGAFAALKSAFEAGGSEAVPSFSDLVSRARAAAARAGDTRQRAWVECIVADDLFQSGDLGRARTVAEAAVADLGRAAEVELLPLLAEIELRARRFAHARTHCAGAEVAFAREGAGAESREPRRARCAVLEAEIALRLGQPESAAVALERAARLTEPDDVESRLDVESVRIQLDLFLEDFEAVRSAVARWMSTPSALPPGWRSILLVRRGIAESELARGGRDSARAEATLREALADPEIPELEARSARRVLVDLALRGSDARTARAMLDSVRANAREAARGSREALMDATQGVQVALAESAAADALRAAADRLALELDAFFHDLDAQRGDSGGLGFLAWGTQRASLSELVRAEIALAPGEAGKERALEHVVRAQAHGLLARELGASDVGLADVRAHLLADGAGVLVLLPAMDRSHVFALDAAGLEHAEVAARDGILAAFADGLGTIVAAPPGAGIDDEVRTRDFEDAARALGDVLFPAAIARRVGTWSEVRVVGADLCGSVPVELAHFADGAELGLVLPVAHLPSLPAGVGLARRAAQRRTIDAGEGIAAVIDPSFDPALVENHPRLVPLRLGARERERVVGPDGTAGIDVVSAAGATIAGLRVLLERRPRLLLVLAHGLNDSTREFPAGLALAPDGGDGGILWADDVANLRAPPCVALLACGGARSRPRLGDDVAGHFGGAFLAAGADAVLVSRSDVALDSALEVAAILRERVGVRGESASRAVLAARRALAGSPRTRDPFHRAHLVLFGVPHAAGPARGARPVSDGSTSDRAAAAAFPWKTAAAVALVALGLATAGARWSSRRRARPGPAERRPGADRPSGGA